MKIKKLNEFKFYTEIDDEELSEMSNISYNTTGIKDVVIWIGPNPHYHGKRVKISNTPSKFNKNNCFTITIPDLEIIGDVNKVLIDSKKLEKIKEFISVNMNVISKYLDEEILTDDMINSLKKV